MLGAWATKSCLFYWWLSVQDLGLWTQVDQFSIADHEWLFFFSCNHRKLRPSILSPSTGCPCYQKSAWTPHFDMFSLFLQIFACHLSQLIALVTVWHPRCRLSSTKLMSTHTERTAIFEIAGNSIFSTSETTTASLSHSTSSASLTHSYLSASCSFWQKFLFFAVVCPYWDFISFWSNQLWGGLCAYFNFIIMTRWTTSQLLSSTSCYLVH